MMMQYLEPNLDKVIYETIDDEVILINFDTGAYYSIVGTGAVIWRAIEQGVMRDQLLNSIVKRYKGDREAISSSVIAFVEELIAEEIVAVSTRDENSEAPISFPGEPTALDFTPPALARYADMSDLLLLDPLHDVSEKGWPNQPSK